uniref:NPC intracellular cholesterol transporter 1 homolog 1b-like n=1 Tax=Bombus vancouverensis nearcticus TaxID=2705178 RepID=UPI00143C2E89|nr:NPC intracellular cholesterol transporter 1 homolog 1b-like [Bombus vancouverensis nearcticus]
MKTETNGLFVEDIIKYFMWLSLLGAKHSQNNHSSPLNICSYVILGLSYGMTYLSITSNPIEILAAPTSRARLEKNYLDSHFQPLYRTEQIYIKSVGLGKIIHNTTNRNLEFGHVFNKEF